MRYGKTGYHHQVGSMPVIRKIFRSGRSYVCALCRSQYESEEIAVQCLNHCWERTLLLPPVIRIVKRFAQAAFKCRFCSRTYHKEFKATACAEHCLGKRQAMHQKDLVIYEIPPEGLHHHKFAFAVQKVAVETKHVSRFKLKRFSDEQLPAANEQTTALVDASQTADESQGQEAAAPAKVRRRKEDFKSAWVRNQAKYECLCCHELYYTRIEVEKCFDAHFDDKGFEMDGAEAKTDEAGGEAPAATGTTDEPAA